MVYCVNRKLLKKRKKSRRYGPGHMFFVYSTVKLPDHKRHSIDIRVVHKDDDVILRIRDDCVPFNPRERKALTDPHDILKNAGIRIVYQIAKSVEYQNLLGLNVLTIRI